jgi:hypothetical protein
MLYVPELLQWRAERMGAMEREAGALKQLKREGHGAYAEVSIVCRWHLLINIHNICTTGVG